MLARLARAQARRLEAVEMARHAQKQHCSPEWVWATTLLVLEVRPSCQLQASLRLEHLSDDSSMESYWTAGPFAAHFLRGEHCGKCLYRERRTGRRILRTAGCF